MRSMKILYFARGQMMTASSRLRVYKIADALRFLGDVVDTKISYADWTGQDVIVVQKRQDFYKEMKRWVNEGIPVIFDIDDPTDRLPEFSLLTVGSKELQSRHEGSVYVPDCLDISNPYRPKKIHNDDFKRVCWFGLACNLYHTEPVYAACEKLGLELVLVTDLNGVYEYPRWENATYIEWELDSVDKVITHCDVVACSYILSGRWNEQWIQAKGENRILKAWGLGMPVVGTPIPSYVDHGLKYTATTEREWITTLSILKDKGARQHDAESGRLRAVERDANNVALKWRGVFKSCLKK